MANINITSSNNRINITANDSANNVGFSKCDFPKSNLSVKLVSDDVGVMLCIIIFGNIPISFNGNNGSRVDSVNSIRPSSNSDLFDKITAILT